MVAAHADAHSPPGAPPVALAALLATLPPLRQATIAARGKPQLVHRCRACGMPLILAYRRSSPVYLAPADHEPIAGSRRVVTVWCPGCGAPRVYTER